MRVFVFSTGRCGSTTLAKACRHITNYSSGHETNAGKVSIDYPDNHIEIDPHLTFNLPMIRTLYPNAIFVHQIREEDGCVASLAKRGSMKNLWIPHAYQKRNATQEDIKRSAFYFYHFFNGIITKYTNKQIRMESFTEDFKMFWKLIGAEGSLEKALAELKIAYNKGKK